MTGDRDYEVVVEFDAWATDIMRGRHWHPSQKITELTAGGSHLQLRVSCIQEVARWVLSWGTHATVLRPNQLAEHIAVIAQALVERYSDLTINQDPQ